MTKWKLTPAGGRFLAGQSAKQCILLSLEESSPNDEREPRDIIAEYEAWIRADERAKVKEEE